MIKKSLWLDPDKKSHMALLERIGNGKAGASDLRRLALGGLALEMEGKLEEAIKAILESASIKVEAPSGQGTVVEEEPGVSSDGVKQRNKALVSF